MLKRWFFSQFFATTYDQLTPVCSAYGARWFCPENPSSPDGWALVQMLTSPDQIEAAKEDSRVLVCGNNDFSVVPDVVIANYAPLGATQGMTMGQLRSVLADHEPLYLNDLN